ncbi:MAG: DNA recombination/repair protein RecA, partial [Oscillospiraceae bacterium]|nr:DNA recombination/repair protein RecA [Oscillospiraceae bacterium]
KIGVMFGPSETTTGGNALKFYSSVRIEVRRGEPKKDGGQVIGYGTKAKVVKNKVAPPFKTAQFDMIFGEGISKLGEIVDTSVQLGIIKKSGSWFSYDDMKIGQGREKVKQYLIDNPTICEEVEKKVRVEFANHTELLTSEADDEETPEAKAPAKAASSEDDDFAEFAPEDLE